VPAPSRAADVLRITDRTLGSSIHEILGIEPDLDVVRQWLVHDASAVRAPDSFPEGSDVLVRCTGYRVGSTRLSRNLAYVDLGRVDPVVASELVSGELHLGQLFLDGEIVKHGYEFGTDTDAPDVDDMFEQCFEDEEVQPFVWRRYLAGPRGEDVYVVVESLPTLVWERLLDSDDARRGLKAEL
jgi:hypothetical protein